MNKPQPVNYDRAAYRADWTQVVLNQGPPCFFLENDRFCLRAKCWAGHTDRDEWPEHRYVSLAALLDKVREEGREAESTAEAHICRGCSECDMPHVHRTSRSSEPESSQEPKPLPPRAYPSDHPFKPAPPRSKAHGKGLCAFWDGRLAGPCYQPESAHQPPE